MFSRVLLLPALLCAFLASIFPGTVSAAEPTRPFTLLRHDGASVFLDYFPSGASGVSILHSSDDLLQLRGTNASLFAVPAGLAPIAFDITSFVGGSHGFFAVTEFPGLVVDDFTDPEPDIDTIGSPYFIQPLSATGALADGQAVTVNFQILDAATLQPLSISGSVSLDVETATGQAPPFTATLTPATLPITNGVVNGTVTVTGTGDFSTLTVGVVSINLTGPAGLANGSPTKSVAGAAPTGAAGGSLTQLPTASDCVTRKSPSGPSGYAAPAGGYQHPLPATTAIIASSFGDWRPSNDGDTAGRPHYGIDLVAGAGTPVKPIARGVVSMVDNAHQQMVVVHGNGAASRYVHIGTSRCVNQIVETSTVIANTVVPNTGAGPHLHLEVMPAGVPVDYWNVLGNTHPGPRVDPASLNASFTPPLINAANYSGSLQIKALYLWNESPGALFGDVGGIRCDLSANGLSPDYLVAELVNLTNTYTLMPATVTFSTEDAAGGAPVQRSTFTFGGETEMLKLFQSTAIKFTNFGYVRRVANAMPKPNQYQMWFKWDTTPYLFNLDGPRQAQLTISGRLGVPTTSLWRFGPKITDPGSQTVDPAAPNGTTFPVTVKSFMGPFPAAQLAQGAGPRDELKFSFLSSAPSWDAFFIDPTNSNAEVSTLKWTFVGDGSGVKEDTIQVRVKLKPGALVPTATETITLKAASGVFPAIAHKMDVQISPCPPGMALIPAGNFQMGNSTNAAEGSTTELPMHTVYVSTFCMDRYEVTKALWDGVRAWGLTHGYTDLPVGSGKAANHPVQTITWYSMVKWCNARSQMQGLSPVYFTNDAQTALYRTGSVNVTNAQVKWSANGYRLPTEAEWEKAARGGLSGQRFPWGDTINHSFANYYNNTYSYESPQNQGVHPTYNDGVSPYTSPVGSFAPNGYGLYDMTGNVWEWCWDWYGAYSSSPGTDPQGPPPGSWLVIRGGSWNYSAFECRASYRSAVGPDGSFNFLGFRTVRR